MDSQKTAEILYLQEEFKWENAVQFCARLIMQINRPIPTGKLENFEHALAQPPL